MRVSLPQSQHSEAGEARITSVAKLNSQQMSSEKCKLGLLSSNSMLGSTVKKC